MRGGGLHLGATGVGGGDGQVRPDQSHAVYPPSGHSRSQAYWQQEYEREDGYTKCRAGDDRVQVEVLHEPVGGVQKDDQDYWSGCGGQTMAMPIRLAPHGGYQRAGGQLRERHGGGPNRGNQTDGGVGEQPVGPPQQYKVVGAGRE